MHHIGGRDTSKDMDKYSEPFNQVIYVCFLVLS